MTAEVAIRRKYRALGSFLNERTRRVWAATEANRLGYGGASLVARATKISRRAILAGQREIKTGDVLPEGRVRRAGGGRKSAVEHQPDLPKRLESLVEPLTRGDPLSPLRWTCKSTRRLSKALERLGYRASSRVVAVLLRDMGYSLQGNCKTVEGNQHPDRDAQFEHINSRVTKEMSAAQPVISVGTKSARNRGFLNVGTAHAAAAFAVASIRAWWRAQGRRAYPRAKRLLITADAGGSDGSRLRTWKWELQKFADELGLPISVCHFPPGTSKWNEVEHRLFSFISSNRRGEASANYETVVNLIAATTPATGLEASCRLDRREPQTGREVSAQEWASIDLRRDGFHGDWNYTIRPRRSR